METGLRKPASRQRFRVSSLNTPMKTLDRQKLDVANKTRSNLFGSLGPFTLGLAGAGRVE